MRRAIYILTALLLVFADFVAVEHKHEDHELHIDCPICIVQHSQADIAKYEPSLKLFFTSFFIRLEDKAQEPVFRPLLKDICIRAPPQAYALPY